ncbi:MAG: YybH family protein [Gammaproteobacteria bacterium]
MPSVAPDPNEIMELERRTCHQTNAGDLSWVTELCKEDVLQFSPGQPLSEGKEKFLAAFQEVVDTEGYDMAWEPTKAVVSASNDMAYAYGTLTMKLPGGEPVAGKYVVVWVKEDGEWRLAIDIPNLDA